MSSRGQHSRAAQRAHFRPSPPAASFLRPADVYTYQTEVFRVSVQVQYGNLELFGLAALCTGFKCRGGDKNGQPCGGLADTTTCVGGGACLYEQCTPCRPCNATSPPLSYVTFSYRKSPLGTLVAGQHTLVAEGPYLAILALLLNLRYRPLPHQNTLRLRNAALNPSTYAAQPYEAASYAVSQRQASGAFAQVRRGCAHGGGGRKGRVDEGVGLRATLSLSLSLSLCHSLSLYCLTNFIAF